MSERLLLLAPTARDGQLSREILCEAGLEAHVCANLDELCDEIEQGAGAVLLTDVTLSGASPERLTETLREQPPWSDLPIVLLSPRGAESATAVWAMNNLSNLTVLEQPVRVMTLVSALRTAVKARQRQYELRDRLEALRLADRQKDEFLATLSHELRNPLAPIRNALHIMRLAGADQETRTRLMDTLERQVGNVIRLVDDLLELSRVNQGRIELRKQRLSLSTVLRGALEVSAPLVEAAGHELIVSEPAEKILIHADPVRMNQIVANLLNNAAKYTERGGRVSVATRLEGADAVISVRDTGIGIPPEMLTRIFDLFVQVDPGDTVSRQGLGIGLTLVKRLVEMHGGTVVARSEGRGTGSEFIVRLPAFSDQRAPGSGGERRPGGERRRQESRTYRILVVDDFHDSADSLAALLRLLGHEVRVAYDGPAALAMADAFQPEAALLDIGMPGMDGIELAKQLRQQRSSKELLLIALTGYGRDEDKRRSLEAGFDSHLVKPVDLPALNALLAEHVPARVEVV